MNKEIHISKVPLTPTGVNHDFKGIKKYEFVRFNEIVKIRTKVLMDPESYLSDNEVDLNLLETNEEKVEAIIKSPMIEVRKKRQSNSLNNGDIRFNPKREDYLETSLGCYKNYQQNRRKTIAAPGYKSEKQNIYKTRRSLSIPVSAILKKENSDPKIELEKELDFLVAAIDHSQTLLNIEHKRLSDMIIDWSHIVETEKDIPLENQGDIKSAIGGVKILLDKRFQSTLNVLDSAEKYVNCNGVLTDDNKKHYRNQDIYGFVDLLIDEIKKIDVEFNKLLNLRNNNWIPISQPITRVRKAPVVKKPVKRKTNPVKIKAVDRFNIREKCRELKKTGIRKSVSVEIFLGKKGENMDNNQDNEVNNKIDVDEDKRQLDSSIRKSSLQLNSEISRKPTVNDEKEISHTENSERNIENEILITPPTFTKPKGRPKSILKSTRRDSKLETSNNEKVTFFNNKNTTEKKDEIDVSINTSSNLSSNTIKTPPSFIKTGIRSKSLLKSNTGTPVHSDTPRPRRSCHKPSEFAKPSLSNVVSKKLNRKRSVAMSSNDEESSNSCPISIPKKNRNNNQ